MKYTRKSCHDVESAPAVFSRIGGTSALGGRRLGESSAALSTPMFGGFTFQAPLPSLLAAGDAVGAWEVGGAQMKKDTKMSSCVTCAKRQICIIEFVATM